jgi:hypothetical protein
MVGIVQTVNSEGRNGEDREWKWMEVSDFKINKEGNFIQVVYNIFSDIYYLQHAFL